MFIATSQDQWKENKKGGGVYTMIKLMDLRFLTTQIPVLVAVAFADPP